MTAPKMMNPGCGDSSEDLRGHPLESVRASIRAGKYGGHTAGLGAGCLQGNVVILPEHAALDFFRFCQRNPKPCPLVGVSDTGNPLMDTLGADIDIRTDVPLYNVYRDGELTDQATDVRDLWRDDFVAFVLGCSFTFDTALMAAGISMRHIEDNKTVSMYRTNIQTVSAGPFGGDMVVSMRALSVQNAIQAIEISARFPQAHGTPVHLGDPAAIGIDDLSTPDWGDPTDMEKDQIPVFWACGVTPQVAIRQAKPNICITHAPGRMLITDVRGSDAGCGQTITNAT